MTSTRNQESALPVVEVVEYVEWLLSQPLHRRMDNRLTADLDTTLAVARALLQLGDSTNSMELRELARAIWNLPLRELGGEIARRSTVEALLRKLSGNLLNAGQCAQALKAIQGFSPRAKPRRLVEYRGKLGAQYYDPGTTTNCPANDLTFRLHDVYSALHEAGCPSPAAFLAKCLTKSTGKRWYSARVETRIKPYKGFPFQWLHYSYRQAYWLHIHSPEEAPPPPSILQPFVFVWNPPEK